MDVVLWRENHLADLAKNVLNTQDHREMEQFVMLIYVRKIRLFLKMVDVELVQVLRNNNVF
jgi:hypothetical protein